MRWSYRIARIAGTDVKVHATFLAFLAFYLWLAWSHGGAGLALGVGLYLVAVFGSVLLHEFGHIGMARRFGVRTPDVVLLPIGGVARLERMPEEPRQELLIALAGPAVTLAIALVLWVGIRLTGGDAPLFTRDPNLGSVAGVMQLNVWLLLFNLLPAFPMDGGRVLRALLATRTGYERATRTAAAVGQLIAIGMGMVALARGEVILTLIAFFVFLGAGAEARAVTARAIGHGMDVARMMVTDFRTLPVHATLADAVELLLAGEQREFPVLDNWGRVEGMLTRDHLIRGLSVHGPAGRVQEVMAPAPPALAPTVGFDEALARLRASGLPALPVVDATGRLIGLLTLDNVSDLMLVRRAVSG